MKQPPPDPLRRVRHYVDGLKAITEALRELRQAIARRRGAQERGDQARDENNTRG